MQHSLPPCATFGGWVAWGLEEVSHDPACLDTGGRWAVLISFEGEVTCARFANWRRQGMPVGWLGRWIGPDPGDWHTSQDQAGYVRAVGSVRQLIARGDVYQVNICRVLRAELPDPGACDPLALHQLLTLGNPAPHGGALRLPDHGVHVASASPELFLRRVGAELTSKPIKGTGRSASDLLPKDEAENVMIVDLVRNDLGRVCVPGSVWVPELLAVEAHPGLVHLVSTVSGRLAAGVGWPQVLAATFPPGSVTGAPKLSAQRIIGQLEPTRRGPYCGAFGWVDADRCAAELAVAIRTFWLELPDGPPRVAFGTGAGITWGSDARAEWAETQLKASRLLEVAAGVHRGANGCDVPGIGT